jgi:hypothetical protein
MRVFVTTFQQMTVLVLDFSHDFHSSPFVHFGGQLVLVDEVVSVGSFLLEGVLVKFSSDGLSTDVGPDGALVVDEAFDDRDDMSELCANIDNQTAFEGEEVSGEDGGFVHEESVEFVGFVEEFDEFLTVLFAAEGRFDVKERVFRWIDEHFFTKRKTSKGLESFPVFDETVIEDGFGVSILLGKGGVEIKFVFFGGCGIGLNIGGDDSIGSFLAGESHFGVEGSDFHNEGNSILMIKTWRDIHY